MGVWRPVKAQPHHSAVVAAMKEDLSAAIAERMQRDPRYEEAVRNCLKSSRAAIFRDFRDGNGAMYGMTRIGQMAEAVGLRPYIAFR